MSKKSITYFSITVLVIGLIFLANGLILAWTAPTAVPPGNNVATPINIGTTEQSKQGRLGVSTSDGDDSYGLTVGSNNTYGIKSERWSWFGGGLDAVGWSMSDNYLYDDSEEIIRANDEWLRLNQQGHFTSGVYTPGVIRADGGLYVSDDEYFWRDAEDRIATADDFYVQSGSSNTYLYSTDTYLGDSSGDTIHVRGNVMSGNNWYMESDGLRLGSASSPGSWGLYVDGQAYVGDYLRADGGIQVDGSPVIDGDAGWHRSYGARGWYNATYGGGIYMTDTSYVRVYNDKYFYNSSPIRTDSYLYLGNNTRGFTADGNYIRARSNYGTVAGMSFYDSDNTRHGYVYGSGDGAYFGLLDGDGYWSYLAAKDSYTSFSIDGNEKMRIMGSENNGNVGIGTTGPFDKLHVNGNIRANRFTDTNANWYVDPSESSIVNNLTVSGDIDFGQTGNVCMFFGACPSGWLDRGQGGYLYNVTNGSCPYSPGGHYASGIWYWCHPRVCCKD